MMLIFAADMYKYMFMFKKIFGSKSESESVDAWKLNVIVVLLNHHARPILEQCAIK